MRRVPVAALVKFLSLALVVALATTVLALTIANASGDDRVSYTARFTDAAGLLRGDDVRIAGVVVGVVDDVRIVDRRIAEVAFSVRRDQRIPATATASILYKNLIGQRFVQLGQGAGPTGAQLPEGGTIPLERTKPPLNLTTLFNGFKPLFTALDPQQVNQLSFEIIQVLQGQGGTIKSLLASTASLTSHLADRDQLIGEVIDNLNGVLETVNARDEQLSELVGSLQALVSGLAKDREPIGDAIESIGELTDVTAGLVGDARPALKDDIEQLGKLAGNLNDTAPKLEKTIRFMPYKLNVLNRSASYGSWFQFYLCGFSGTVGLSPVIPPITTPTFKADVPRCGSDPKGTGNAEGDADKAADRAADKAADNPLADLPLPSIPGSAALPQAPEVPTPQAPKVPDLPLVGG